MKEQGLFSRNFKNQLREQGWRKLQSADTNPAQYWRRKREQTIGAFEDISFFLKELPEEKRRDILSYETLFPLIELTMDGIESDIEDHFMYFILCTLNHYLFHLTRIYSSRNTDSPNLSSLTIEHLQRTQSICGDITNILMNENAETEGHNRGLQFLFKSLDRSIQDRKRLTSVVRRILRNSKDAYATGRIDDDNVDFLKVITYVVLNKNPGYYIFKGKIYDPDPTVPEDTGVEIGELVIEMDPINSKAHLHILIANVKLTTDLHVVDKGKVKYFYIPKNQVNKKGSIKSRRNIV